MNAKEKEEIIRELRLAAKAITAQIDVLKNERLKALSKISTLTWEPIGWEDLQQLLREEYPENNYRKNPTVANSLDGHHTTYCKINAEGDLQVGPYYYNDRFPRGKSLYIHFNKKPWG